VQRCATALADIGEGVEGMSRIVDVALPLLHRLPPETAHRLALAGLKLPVPRAPAPPEALAVKVFGKSVPSPIGLAAGFDKDAGSLAGLYRLGFGFVEAGTVTPRPQAGNPRPRLFRLEEDAAIINRMGFNSGGHDRFERNVERFRKSSIGARAVLGINLGANKDADDKIADYVEGVGRLSGYADYVVVNISSPNTPGLRGLQEGAQLDELLDRLANARARLTLTPPLLLKLAPDLDDAALEALVERAIAHRLDGLIATNTTTMRPPTLRSRHREQAGGLSGAPLKARAQSVLEKIAALAKGQLTLVGVGGIASAEDARARLAAGAALVQTYTGFVYQGAAHIRAINEGLATPP